MVGWVKHAVACKEAQAAAAREQSQSQSQNPNSNSSANLAQNLAVDSSLAHRNADMNRHGSQGSAKAGINGERETDRGVYEVDWEDRMRVDGEQDEDRMRDSP